MSDSVRDFKELRVYHVAFACSMRIFDLTKTWPASERYALTDQIRRSSRSVCACVAEAWFKKRYPNHFASKLSDALSEAAETIVWVDLAHACGYVSEEVAVELDADYRRTIGGLTKMIDQREKWCGPAPPHVREEGTEYWVDS